MEFKKHEYFISDTTSKHEHASAYSKHIRQMEKRTGTDSKETRISSTEQVGLKLATVSMRLRIIRCSLGPVRKSSCMALAVDMVHIRRRGSLMLCPIKPRRVKPSCLVTEHGSAGESIIIGYLAPSAC